MSSKKYPKMYFQTVEECVAYFQNRKKYIPSGSDPTVYEVVNDHFATLEFKQVNLQETDHLEYSILTSENMYQLVQISLSFNQTPKSVISNRCWNQISFNTTNCGIYYHFFEYAWMFKDKKTKECIGFVSMYDMLWGHRSQICKSCSIGLYSIDNPQNRIFLEEALVNLINQVSEFYKISVINVRTYKGAKFIQELLLKHEFSQIDDYRNPSENFYRLNLDYENKVHKELFKQNYSRIKNKYSVIGKLSEGFIRVAIGDRICDRKYGFINSEGDVVIPLIYSGVKDFHEGLAAVKIENISNGKWGFINTKGELVISFLFLQPRHFSDGFAKVVYNSEWCFVDAMGEKLILLSDYKGSCSFRHGYALVKNSKHGSMYGLINKNGALVVPCVHDNKYSVWGALNSESNSLVDEKKIYFLENKK